MGFYRVSFNRNAKSFKAKCGLRMMITPLPSIEYEHDILDGSEDSHWNTMATQEEADQATDHITKADDYVLGVPDLNMESLTDKSMPPHSLITLICPDASISGTTYTPTGLPGNFGATTTIMNLTPSTVPNSRWIPKGEYYGANPFDVDDGVCEHLGRLFDRLKFKKLVPKAGNTHSREVNPKAECCIITGYNGQSIMRRNLYRNNDNHGNDSSFEDVKYRGVVLTVASEWDNQNYDWRTGFPYTTAHPGQGENVTFATQVVQVANVTIEGSGSGALVDPAEVPAAEVRRCPVCGRDISHQHPRSKVCSERIYGKAGKRCRNTLSNRTLTLQRMAARGGLLFDQRPFVQPPGRTPPGITPLHP